MQPDHALLPLPGPDPDQLRSAQRAPAVSLPLDFFQWPGLHSAWAPPRPSRGGCGLGGGWHCPEKCPLCCSGQRSAYAGKHRLAPRFLQGLPPVLHTGGKPAFQIEPSCPVLGHTKTLSDFLLLSSPRGCSHRPAAVTLIGVAHYCLRWVPVKQAVCRHQRGALLKLWALYEDVCVCLQ